MVDSNCCLLAYYNKENSNYNCQLSKCRNFDRCQEKIPKCVKVNKNNLCIDCNIMLGEHLVSQVKDNCPYCLKVDNLLILPCKHTICNDCWYYITRNGYENNSSYLPYCPLCRNQSFFQNKK